MVSRNFDVVRCGANGAAFRSPVHHVKSRSPLSGISTRQIHHQIHHKWNDRMILFHENLRIIYRQSFHPPTRSTWFAFRIRSLLSQVNTGSRSVRFRSGRKTTASFGTECARDSPRVRTTSSNDGTETCKGDLTRSSLGRAFCRLSIDHDLTLESSRSTFQRPRSLSRQVAWNRPVTKRTGTYQALQLV